MNNILEREFNKEDITELMESMVSQYLRCNTDREKEVLLKAYGAVVDYIDDLYHETRLLDLLVEDWRNS